MRQKNEENYEYCDLATQANPLQGNGGAWCNGTLQGGKFELPSFNHNLVTPGARPSGVIDKLDYIEGLGFDCIWITPVVKSLDYTGYFAEDTECDDFNTCHTKCGMSIMSSKNSSLVNIFLCLVGIIPW